MGNLDCCIHPVPIAMPMFCVRSPFQHGQPALLRTSSTQSHAVWFVSEVHCSYVQHGQSSLLPTSSTYSHAVYLGQTFWKTVCRSGKLHCSNCCIHPVPAVMRFVHLRTFSKSCMPYGTSPLLQQGTSTVTSFCDGCCGSQKSCPYKRIALTQGDHCSRNAVIGVQCIGLTSRMSWH